MKAMAIALEMQRASFEGRPVCASVRAEMRRRWVRKHDGYFGFAEMYYAALPYARERGAAVPETVAERVAGGAPDGCMTRGELVRAVDALVAREAMRVVP